jgi:hypothetical protein
MPATPTDTYIYLKGGRGDGFVPTWTGTISEEGMVDGSGVIVGTDGKEVSEPYRDIFQSTLTGTEGIVTGTYSGPITSPLLTFNSLSSPATIGGSGTSSDEAAHTKPRQYYKVFTWLLFTSSNGLVYKFRKDLVVGWGSAARA